MRTAGVEPAQPCGRGILSWGQIIDFSITCYAGSRSKAPSAPRNADDHVAVALAWAAQAFEPVDHAVRQRDQLSGTRTRHERAVRPLCAGPHLGRSVAALIVLGFGAIVVLVYRDRRPGFSYFACGMTTPKVDQDF